MSDFKRNVLTLFSGIILGYAVLPRVIDHNVVSLVKQHTAVDSSMDIVEEQAMHRRLLSEDNEVGKLRGAAVSQDSEDMNRNGDDGDSKEVEDVADIGKKDGDAGLLENEEKVDKKVLADGDVTEEVAKEVEDTKGLELNADSIVKPSKELNVSDLSTLFVSDLLSQQSLPTSNTPEIMKTKKLPDHERLRILVTGGAGFVGSHLVDKLMMAGHEVIVLDNLFTGQRKNVEHWKYHPNFTLIVRDVTEPFHIEVDQIYHLACPASPPHYQYNPIKTIKTSTMGTLNMLGLAKRVKARILLASTSEIYGDPEKHPQTEDYWGNVNTIGPRACYDEGKRVAETMMYSYRDQTNIEVRVARIFNTFGPRMHPNDGRVVSNFIIQALQDKHITIYGDGNQSRSFQYIDDLVNGLHKLMTGDYDLPVNIGNPQEYSVKDFAEKIIGITQSKSEIKYLDPVKDDPHQRKPDISTAKKEIKWEPEIDVDDGLNEAIKYFKRVLDESGEIIPTGPGAAKPKEFGLSDIKESA